MTDLSEDSIWNRVVRIETTDAALGGNETNQPNLANKQLANRDLFLFDQIAEIKSSLASSINGGRLTIDPVNPTLDVFRQNSKIVYWLPYKSRQIALWTGSAWDIFEIPSGGLQVDTQGWPTPQTRDIFVYYNSVTQAIALETRTWGDANQIANRGYVIENFQGVNVLQSDRTRRWIGCIYNSAQSTLGTPGIHEDANICDLWNVDNQVSRYMSFSTDNAVATISHTTPRIAKSAFTFDFFRVVSGDPSQIIRMSAAGQLLNGTSTNSGFYSLRFSGFNDRVSSATAASVFTPNQISASANAGLVTNEGFAKNRGAQTIYLQDFRSGLGNDPTVQFVQSGMIWRY